MTDYKWITEYERATLNKSGDSRPKLILVYTATSSVASETNRNGKNDKSAQRRRKHCALAVVRQSQKISHQPQTRGAGRPKFNQLETVTTFAYRPSLVRIGARNFELPW